MRRTEQLLDQADSDSVGCLMVPSRTMAQDCWVVGSRGWCMIPGADRLEQDRPRGGEAPGGKLPVER